MPDLLLPLVDPRGRCNRKGLLVAALVLLAAEVLAALVVWLAQAPVDHPALIAVKALLLWTAIAVACQRLHDLGRSAWQMLWATLALFAWSFAITLAAAIGFGPEHVIPGTVGFWLIFGAIALPMMAALLWLHVAAGQDHANRYGPAPSGLGFARPHHRSRRAPEGALAA